MAKIITIHMFRLERDDSVIKIRDMLYNLHNDLIIDYISDHVDYFDIYFKEAPKEQVNEPVSVVSQDF